MPCCTSLRPDKQQHQPHPQEIVQRINLCSLLIIILSNDKNQKPCLSRQLAEKILALNPKLLVNKLTKANRHWYNALLNMLFHKCSYKNSCFFELVYNSNVLLVMPCNFFLLVYVAYPLRLATICLLVISKILSFEIEN